MPSDHLPELPGILSAEAVAQTAAYLLSTQEGDGAIPWFPGGHLDVWDHVECAMALAVAGHTDAAGRAYTWLADTQRPDGSWPAKLRQGRVADASGESNHAAYPAVGLWHHLLITGDEEFAHRMWPTVHRGIEFALGLQTERGEVLWARGPEGHPGDHALLTACASIHHALRCATALGERLGYAQPDWELASAQLSHLIACHESVFADRGRFAMDWYYPILSGAVRGGRAAERLARRWDSFVVPGHGVRCVSDQPWVTGAETSELVMALAALGEYERGIRLFAEIQRLRDPDDGAYWTGYQFAQDLLWPVERSTWTSAAVILTADTLCGATAGARVFSAVPADTAPADPAACGCAARERLATGPAGPPRG